MSTKTATTSPLSRIDGWIRKETSGGILLIIAAVFALAWSNSPWREAYNSLSQFVIGPEALGLNLTLGTWAADGVLAIFFFVVGVELKRELVVGSLSSPREAAVPMIAAVGGMIAPALIFVTIVLATGDTEALTGWAIPTATDIAFAVGVLAVFGKGLPRALRTFLLTLAVVDDLLAIVIIAAVYTDHLNFIALGISIVLIAAFAWLVRAKKVLVLPLVIIAILAWYFMHESGVHATVAGVAMGLSVTARPIHGEKDDRTERFAHVLDPLSSGIVLPIFAFFAAGVTIVGSGGEIFTQPVFFAAATALVVGKFIGVLGTTTLAVKLTPLHLPDAIGLRDLIPVGFLTGMGFTVSLLITDLSFHANGHLAPAKIGVLVGTLIAAILGATALRHDAKKARTSDMNLDGIPDSDTSPID
ncbi:Na+/H+ antiporter NhaA [Actinomyces minihominis]|uniref:Na+/H+ antiporter NhaA n=1 Tax=Actinomyces minihominis TaxID=2002838 RepID=UPI000C08D9D0|nr:Na+/H+ antiporter NhaA [Actinomyces minihominis]